MTLRRAVGVTILALWVGAIGFHVRREYFRTEAAVLAEGARRLAPGTHFYSVRMDGEAIGLASSRVDTLSDGFLIDDLLRLEIPAAGAFHAATVRTRARLGPSLDLRAFNFTLDSEIGDFTLAGEVQPDSTFVVTVGGEGAAAASDAATLRLDRAALLPVALPLRLAAGGQLEAGREVVAEVFDPSAMSTRRVTLRVTGQALLPVADSVARTRAGTAWVAAREDTVPTWIVEERFGGVRVTSWLDAEGRVVRAESPMGLTMVRAPYELAEQAWRRARSRPGRAAGYGSVIGSTAIASNVDLTGVETALDSLRVRLGGVDVAGFDLDGGRQVLRGDTLTVWRAAGGALGAGYALPYEGGGEAGEALAPEPLVQSDHPAIRETARRAVGDTRDPWEAALRLNDWVHRGVRKDITLSVPSALQVLERRQGDCNEHTVLYVALARAVGLPARTAVGLVHVNGRFYYHAWPEVWVDGWVAVDPTLGQAPADASHLRFLVGGLARQVELVRLIGRLELDILERGA